ncbi:MAG: hypothetical protein AB1705_05860 [Verrucomicrobiota bacterium]
MRASANNRHSPRQETFAFVVIPRCALTQWLLAFLLAGADSAPAAESRVTAQLRVPPAETYVIGDTVPLYWRFENQSDEPLAFMWEGCCRLNGRLTVTATGKDVRPVPPGQAIAHMFAKAERLDPGKPRDFDTRLSDWVTLRDTGEYELRGRYTGVLPTQKPMVARGLKLWRDAAETPPIKVSLLSVTDYLREREQRATQRGLQLQIAGAAKVPPLAPNPLRLTLASTGPAAQKLRWPGSVELWILDPEGQRVAGIPTDIEGAYEEITLEPGARLAREVSFSSALLEGLPFGRYQAFVDLHAGGDGAPRVPSNPVAFDWRLDGADVAQLLTAAAKGPQVGARNRALKLLRLQLGELDSALASVRRETLAEPAAALARELELAACLKPLAEKPGRVDWPLRVDAAGNWRFAEPRLAACATKFALDGSTGLGALLAVRRHLGVEVGLQLKPAPDATAGAVMKAAGQLPLAELAAPPFARASADTNVTGLVQFRSAPGPANLVLRLRRASGGVRCEFARRLPDPDKPQMPAAFRPEEIGAQQFQPLAGAEALEQLLQDGRMPSPQVLLLAADDVAWRDVLAVIEPVLKRGLAVDLAAWREQL